MLKPMSTLLLNRVEEMYLICTMVTFTIGAFLPDLREEQNESMVTLVVYLVIGILIFQTSTFLFLIFTEKCKVQANPICALNTRFAHFAP